MLQDKVSLSTPHSSIRPPHLALQLHSSGGEKGQDLVCSVSKALCAHAKIYSAERDFLFFTALSVPQAAWCGVEFAQIGRH